LLEVQRCWARNHRPGPEASVFADETLILSTLSTGLEPCIRCGSMFVPQDNSISSCVFHADCDGTPGEFHSNPIAGYKKWSCCGQTWEGAPGCSSRPHICKEMMISVRADTQSVFSLRGADLTIFQTLEVSAFPGSSHTLRVQITSSLVDVLHEYFVIEGKGTNATHHREVHKRDSVSSQDSQRGKQQIVGLAPPAPRSFWRPRAVTTASAESAYRHRASLDDTKSVNSSHTEDSDGQSPNTPLGG